MKKSSSFFTLISSLLIFNSSLYSYEVAVNKTQKIEIKKNRDNSSQTVYDPNTNLIWQDNSDVKTVKKDWSGSINYCKSLKFAGKSDWRLPTIEELKTIVDKQRNYPAIKNTFKNIVSDFYWSSSQLDDLNSLSVWRLNFAGGTVSYRNNSYNYYVRCVRNILKFEKLINKFMEQELSSIPKPPAELNLVKDMFETQAEFEKRVEKTKKTQAKEIAEYKEKVANEQIRAKKVAIQKALESSWGKPIISNLKYDAENSLFVADIKFEAKSDFKKKIAIKMNRSEAKGFYKEFSKLTPEAVFDVDDSSVSLKDIRIAFGKKDYIAQFTDLNIADTKVAVNLKNDYEIDTNINTNIKVAKSTVNNFDASRLTNFSELDSMLDKASNVKSDNSKWLFVVGVEKYKYTDNISYAKRSADMFVKVAQKRLGVPKEHSYILINDNATQAEIKNNLKMMLRNVKSNDTIYFYYNGHGVPISELKNEPFMLATDSNPDFISDDKFFSLQNIYSNLSSSKASKVVAFVDSCFSGQTDGKSVLKGVAATKLKPRKVEFDKDKMVVLSAGKSHQYSNGYDKKGHRLFSFYVMQNIIEGKTDIKTLFNETKEETYDTSYKEFGDLRVQEPTIDGNFRLSL